MGPPPGGDPMAMAGGPAGPPMPQGGDPMMGGMPPGMPPMPQGDPSMVDPASPDNTPAHENAESPALETSEGSAEGGPGNGATIADLIQILINITGGKNPGATKGPGPKKKA